MYRPNWKYTICMLQHTIHSDVITPNDVTVTSEASASCSCAGCKVHGSVSTKSSGTKSMDHHRARIVDLVSRVLFPSLFIAFNVVYWTYLYTAYDS